MIWEYIYFIAKDNSSELIKEFHYRKNFLLSCSVVMMWLDQYSLEDGNRFVIMTDNST